MAKEQRRQINKLYNSSTDTNNKIDRLEFVGTQENSVNFFKKKNEFIIYEDQLMPPATLTTSYEFEGLRDEDLHMISILPIFNTTEGFQMNNYFFHTLSSYWKKIGNIHRLTIRVSAYIFDPNTGSSLTTPVFVNLKLITYNERVYHSVQNMKS